MNCKGDEDVDAKRSRPSIGKPDECHASKERVLLIGTDQRITSGPAARTAAFRGRIHDCTRIVSRKVRFFSLAPRPPSIHDPQETLTAKFCCDAQHRHIQQCGSMSFLARGESMRRREFIS